MKFLPWSTVIHMQMIKKQRPVVLRMIPALVQKMEVRTRAEAALHLEASLRAGHPEQAAAARVARLEDLHTGVQGQAAADVPHLVARRAATAQVDLRSRAASQKIPRLRAHLEALQGSLNVRHQQHMVLGNRQDAPVQ
jgi:hypothetical protein